MPLPASPPTTAPTAAPATAPMGPATEPAAAPAAMPPAAAPSPVPTGCAPGAPLIGSRLALPLSSLRFMVMVSPRELLYTLEAAFILFVQSRPRRIAMSRTFGIFFLIATLGSASLVAQAQFRRG